MNSSIKNDRISDAILQLYSDHFGFGNKNTKKLLSLSPMNKKIFSKFNKQATFNEMLLHEICHVVVEDNSIKKAIDSDDRPFNGDLKEILAGALTYLVLNGLKTRRWSTPERAKMLGVALLKYDHLVMLKMLHKDADLAKLAKQLITLIKDSALEVSGSEYKKYI